MMNDHTIYDYILQDDIYMGYVIPKGTAVMPNAWYGSAKARWLYTDAPA